MTTGWLFVRKVRAVVAEGLGVTAYTAFLYDVGSFPQIVGQAGWLPDEEVTVRKPTKAELECMGETK